MGGGGSGSSGITMDSGGLAYPTTSGSGTDYTALGNSLSKILTQYGSTVSAQGQHNYMTNTPNMPQSSITAAQPQTNVIPYGGMLGASVPSAPGGGSMEALMRLLQGMYS